MSSSPPSGAARRLDSIASPLARLPWWAWGILALVSAPILHSIDLATRAGTVARMVAATLQWAVPAALLCVCALAGWHARRAGARAPEFRESSIGEVLGTMSWQRFLHLLAEGFRRAGFVVVDADPSRPHAVIDLVLRRGPKTYIVNCRQWREAVVGVEPLRATHSAAAARGLAGGLVVTSGSFSAEAMKFAEGRHLHLIGGRRLSELLGTVRDVGDVHSQTTQPAPMSMLTPLDRRFPPVPPAEGDHAR